MSGAGRYEALELSFKAKFSNPWVGAILRSTQNIVWDSENMQLDQAAAVLQVI
tara:strand:- start:495 stop:653 length:159 start_codon:yes stop_codon:yes gene_type:complete